MTVTCRVCGADPYENALPTSEAGGFSVCAACTEVSVVYAYSRGLEIREPTDAEREAFYDAGGGAIVDAVFRQIAKRTSGEGPT